MATAEKAVSVTLWKGIVRSCGVSIQYRRNGANLGLPFVAVKGKSNTETVSATSVETLIADDWICRKEDLVSRGINNPERGDRITWQDSASVFHTYEVLHTPGDRQWAKVDQLGLLVRIHSKEIMP